MGGGLEPWWDETLLVRAWWWWVHGGLDHLRESVSGRRRENTRKDTTTRRRTYLLSTLLLSEHLLLLRNDLCLVLQAHSEGQADEECAGSDDPHEVPDETTARLDERRGGGKFCSEGMAGGRGYDVDEGGETVVEGFFAVEVRSDGGEGDGGASAGGGLGGVGGGVGLRVLLLDDLNFDHRCESVVVMTGRV